jgi:hypothetical protein
MGAVAEQTHQVGGVPDDLLLTLLAWGHQESMA